MQRGPSAGYGFGGPAAYGGPGPVEEQNGGFLEQLRPYTTKIEDLLDTVSEPVKP